MVGIKDFEMPDNCYDCDLHNYHECDLTRESIEDDYCYNGDSREKHCPLIEIEEIPKDQYEARLKADMVAMLTEIQLEIEKLNMHGSIQLQSYRQKTGRYRQGFERAQYLSTKVIQQKMNVLTEGTDDR